MRWLLRWRRGTGKLWRWRRRWPLGLWRRLMDSMSILFRWSFTRASVLTALTNEAVGLRSEGRPRRPSPHEHLRKLRHDLSSSRWSNLLGRCYTNQFAAPFFVCSDAL